jgi:hypothetical protein
LRVVFKIPPLPSHRCLTLLALAEKPFANPDLVATPAPAESDTVRGLLIQQSVPPDVACRSAVSDTRHCPSAASQQLEPSDIACKSAKVEQSGRRLQPERDKDALQIHLQGEEGGLRHRIHNQDILSCAKVDENGSMSNVWHESALKPHHLCACSPSSVLHSRILPLLHWHPSP